MGSWWSSEAGSNEENIMAAKTFVDDKIKSKKLVVFSKTTCPFCTKAKAALKKYVGSVITEEDYEVIEMNTMNNCQDLQDYLLKLTGARTVPRVFINGKSIGGCDDVLAKDKSGELKSLLS